MRVVFMGTPEAAVPSLKRLLQDGHEVVAVWTQPDKPAGRGKKIAIPPVKQLALAHNLTVHQPAKIRTDEARQLFVSLEAEIAVVVAYGRILPSEFLRAPRRGCINVHFSLLPLYRGAAPVNWVILKGEKKTGVTTMVLEERLDSGPILLQRETEIGEEETAPELMRRLAEMGGELLGATLSQLNSITPRTQRDRDATLAPMMRKEDGLISWSDNSLAIARAVRALQPWPNAYTHFQTRQLIIRRASPLSAPAPAAVPGQVIAAHGDELVVQCGQETALRLEEIQLESKRRMSVRDFLNGIHLQIGDRFGEV